MNSLWLHLALLCVIYQYVKAAPKAPYFEDNPALTTGYLEGDMVVSYSRNGEPNPAKYWPNGELYYKIDDGFDKSQVTMIKQAMELIQAASCIKFKEATNEDKDFVLVTNKNPGCFSQLGKVRGMQPLNLGGDYCFVLGTVQHELLHILGFYHQHTSANRDQFVRIHEENIFNGARSQFDIQPQSIDFGVPYDYGSVMHYSSSIGAKSPGLVTIEALFTKDAEKMGQRLGLSWGDVNKLNLMYKC